MKHRHHTLECESLRHVQEDLRPRQPLFLHQPSSVGIMQTGLASRSYLEWTQSFPPLGELKSWRLYSGRLRNSFLQRVEARK